MKSPLLILMGIFLLCCNFNHYCSSQHKLKKNNMKTNYLLLLSALITLLTSSCTQTTPDVRLSKQIKNDSLQKDTAIFSANMEELNIENSVSDKITANIVFPAGRIRILKGDSNLVNCNFRCTNSDWNPEISFKENSLSGEISIEPKKKRENLDLNSSDTCRWIIEFNSKKKYHIDLQMGAGKGDLNLEGLIIQSLELKLGAGDVNVNLKNTSVPNIELAVGAGKAIIDLTGNWNNNLTAKIAGGVGEIEVHLPKDVGVIAEINGLLGDVEATGFNKDDNTYKNNCLGKTKYNLNLEIDGAIGKVKLVLE